MKKKYTQLERQEQIRKQLLGGNEVSIEKLALQFHVSQMTIRRDLELLQSNGEVVRTYGGATMTRKLTFEFTFQDKQHLMAEQKRRIAAFASEKIIPGQVIFLDTGTTALEIARNLIAKGNFTVITTSLAVVSELQFADNIEVLLLGGYLRKGSPDLHGPLTEMNIDFLKADIAFMGADAVDIKGNTYTDDLKVVNLDRKMAQNAKSVIITVDSSKFDKNSMCRVFTPAQYDSIITDSGIDEKTRNRLVQNNVKIKVA